MSQENVELVRRAYEDFIAGRSEFDAEGTLTKIAGEELRDPEIEWDASEASATPDIGGVYRGIEAVRQWRREWLAVWEVVQFEYELVDAREHMVALIDQRMRGRSTGIEVPLGKYAQVSTFSGRVDRALEALPQPVGSARSRRAVGRGAHFFLATRRLLGESPGGISPPGARRTRREPLDSPGSHRPAVLRLWLAHAAPPAKGG
jgi:hypothetical protein